MNKKLGLGCLTLILIALLAAGVFAYRQHLYYDRVIAEAQAMGLPIAPLPVLMAVDAIPDVLATVGNVTGDMTANALVASRQSITTTSAPISSTHTRKVSPNSSV